MIPLRIDSMLFTLLLLLLGSAHAETPAHCGDMYLHSCKNKNLNDGTGSTNPNAVTQTWKEMLRETFPAFLDKIKTKAGRTPSWGTGFAKKINAVTSADTCTPDLACLQQGAVRPLMARIYLNGLGFAGNFQTTGMPILGAEVLPLSVKADQLKTLSSDPTVKRLAAVDEKNMRQRFIKLAQPSMDRVRGAFEITKTEALNYIRENLPVNKETNKIIAGLKKIQLDKTPDKSLQSIWQSNAFFDEGKVIYSAGYAYSSDSLFKIASTLAHEIAHSFDPCTFTKDLSFNEKDPKNRNPFVNVVACLRRDDAVRAQTFQSYMRETHPEIDYTNPFAPALAGEELDFMQSLEKYCKSSEPPAPATDRHIREVLPVMLTKKRFTELQKLCPPLRKYKYKKLKEVDDQPKIASDGETDLSDGSPEGSCSENDQVGEAFCDWFSAQILPGILDKLLKGKTLTPEQYANGMANLRDDENCMNINPTTKTKKPKEFGQHPADYKRIQIMYNDPEMLKRMNCPREDRYKSCGLDNNSNEPAGTGETPVKQ